MNIDIVSTVFPEAGIYVKARCIRPMRFCKGNDLGKATIPRALDAPFEQRLRDPFPSTVPGHRHSDDSGRPRLVKETDSAHDFVVALNHIEVMTSGNKRSIDVVKVRIQCLIDHPKMFAQSIKYDSASCRLVPWGKWSDGQGH